MNARGVRLGWIASLLIATAGWADEAKNASLLGAVTWREDYEVGGGVALVREIADSISIYAGVEYVSVEDTSSYADAFYQSKTKREADGFEVQFGYLHRVIAGERMTLQIGPAIGLEEIDGEERTSYSGEFGSGSSSVDIDYGLGLSAYLQAILRVRAFSWGDVMASVAWGYRGAREISYGDGGAVPLARSGVESDQSFPWDPFDDDATSFLRAALGLAIQF